MWVNPEALMDRGLTYTVNIKYQLPGFAYLETMCLSLLNVCSCVCPTYVSVNGLFSHVIEPESIWQSGEQRSIGEITP